MPRGGRRLGAGRKANADGPTVAAPIRLSEDRIAAYREAAARCGWSLGVWVGFACDDAVDNRRGETMVHHKIGSGVCDSCDAEGVLFAHSVKTMAVCAECLPQTVERCEYCNADVPTRETVPAKEDDGAWAELAKQHDASCEWVKTRAHRD